MTSCLWSPGSYDHTVRVYDARLEKCVMSMEHGQPVESVLLYPSDGLLVSIGVCVCVCVFSAVMVCKNLCQAYNLVHAMFEPH